MTFIWIQIVAPNSKSRSISEGSKLRMFTQCLLCQQIPQPNHKGQMCLGGSFPLKLSKSRLKDPPGSDQKPDPQPLTLLQAWWELHILFSLEILIGDETVHSQLPPSQPSHPGQRTKITLPIIRYPDERKGWMGPVSIWALKAFYLILFFYG